MMTKVTRVMEQFKAWLSAGKQQAYTRDLCDLADSDPLKEIVRQKQELEQRVSHIERIALRAEAEQRARGLRRGDET